MKSIIDTLGNTDIATKTVTCEKHGDFESRNWIGSVWSRSR